MSGVSPVIRFESDGYDSRLAIDRNQWPLGLLRASRPRWEFDVATPALDGDLPLHWQMERDMQPSHPRSTRSRQDVFNDQILLQHGSVITSHWPIC